MYICIYVNILRSFPEVNALYSIYDNDQNKAKEKRPAGSRPWVTGNNRGMTLLLKLPPPTCGNVSFKPRSCNSPDKSKCLYKTPELGQETAGWAI